MRSNDFFLQILYFYGSFNAEFHEDFRHGNNSSVTSKSPSLPKFKNIFHVGAIKIIRQAYQDWFWSWWVSLPLFNNCFHIGTWILGIFFTLVCITASNFWRGQLPVRPAFSNCIYLGRSDFSVHSKLTWL